MFRPCEPDTDNADVGSITGIFLRYVFTGYISFLLLLAEGERLT